MLNDNYEDLVMNNNNNNDYANQMQIPMQPNFDNYNINYQQQQLQNNPPPSMRPNNFQQPYDPQFQQQNFSQPPPNLPINNPYAQMQNNPNNYFQEYNQFNQQQNFNRTMSTGNLQPMEQNYPGPVPDMNNNLPMQDNPNQFSPPQRRFNYPQSARISSQMNRGNTNQDYDNSQIKIIPQNSVKDTNRLEIQKKMLKDEWLQQIEDKKRRKAEEKKKEMEEDLKAEQKWNQYIEEQKQQEKLAKERERLKYQEMASPVLQQQSPIPGQKTPASVSNVPNYSQNDNMSNQTSNNIYDQSFQVLRNNPPMPEDNQYQRLVNMNYANLQKTLDDNINEQIVKLRSDVNSQYIEMSNLFGKLKMDVVEANQLKAEAERELNYIRDELLKSKMTNILYENKLNQVLERNAPYNNLHIPYRDVNPMYGVQNQKPKPLQQTSSMVYTNDMVNEKNVKKVRQLSALAQVGQSLVGESEFVPIPTDSNNPGPAQGSNTNVMSSGLAGLPDNFSVPNISPAQMNTENSKNPELINSNSTKILDEYMNKGEYQDMYTKLCEIADINHNMNKEAQARTLKKDFEIDYNAINGNSAKKEEIQKLDKLLNEIIDNTKNIQH